MSANKPLWLRTVLRVERAIGGPVESVVRSDTYFDTVAKVSRVKRKTVNTVEGVSRRGLHLLNLPAGTDLRRVREQLMRVERRLEQLSLEVSDLDEEPRRRTGVE
jgi:hypothetical protein